MAIRWLDPAALYFVYYDGLVNNDSCQQSGILGYAGYQYAAWCTADRRHRSGSPTSGSCSTRFEPPRMKTGMWSSGVSALT